MGGKSTRTFPALVRIKDEAVHESMRQNWQQTYDHGDELKTLRAQVATLESQVSTLQSSISTLQSQMVQALTQASGQE